MTNVEIFQSGTQTIARSLASSCRVEGNNVQNCTYSTIWTDITANISAMTQHTEGYDGAIWRTIELTNDVAYKYYAIKCANNHGDGNNIGLRRVVFKKLV